MIVVPGAGGYPSLPGLLEGVPPQVLVAVHGAPPGALGLEREVWWAGDDAAALGRAVDAVAPADVVLLHGDCRLGAGWFERLRAAALASADTATASALTGIEAGDPGQAADSVARGALRLRPRLAAPSGPCVYLRRRALELVGGLDSGFAARCLAAGLAHVLADDVLAVGGSDAHPPEAPAQGTRISQAIGAARRALTGLTVTIDARELRGALSGWHVAAVELIGAMAASGEVALTAFVDQQASPEALEALSPTGSLRIVHTAAEAGARTSCIGPSRSRCPRI